MADPKHPSRRAVLASAALVPVAALTVPAQQTAVVATLSPDQLKTLEAFVDRLIPADELGPGAAAAGAHNYINIQLAGYLAPERTAFLTGLDGLDAYANRVHGAGFGQLSAAQRDEVLTAMDQNKAEGFQNARNFFNRARRLTLEGTFGDPHYGGNNNGIGWDIIRYPGPRPAVTPEQQRLSNPATPYRNSAWGTSEHEH
ncbi:MAG: gluconate 2-dehydrogenase subunit 3 family protein [Acidobacteriota bacterium]